jgi:LacI family transcriptional regulator
MKRTPKVVLLIESSRGAGRALLCGIAQYAHDHGPWSFYWEPRGLDIAWPVVESLEADGIILRGVAQLDKLLALGVPTVVAGHRSDVASGFVNLVTDSAAIARLAAEYLLACRFKHFAYCGFQSTQLEHTNWSRQRQISFEEHIVAAGLARPPSYTLAPLNQNWGRERAELARWLDSLPKPVGIMACNDDCGVQVMEACKLAGLAVPETVGVVGVDNDEVVCGLADPPMSSVAVRFEQAGYLAARALDRLMRGRKKIPGQILVSASHVVIRRSTDTIALEEPHVARALRHIREKAETNLSVDEVAQVTGISRRGLERLFRQHTGGSILDAIRRERTGQIARLLVETQLSIRQIAERTGFPDTQHFARYFRSMKKMSPLAWRRKFARSLSQNGG